MPASVTEIFVQILSSFNEIYEKNFIFSNFNFFNFQKFYVKTCYNIWVEIIHVQTLQAIYSFFDIKKIPHLLI